MKSSRRRAAYVVGGGLLILLAFNAWRVGQVLSIGVAYKAKMLCSAIFVAGRDPSTAQRELQIDDLSILRHLGASVDAGSRSVTASALGLFTRRAIHRDGLGCALALDGLVPVAGPIARSTAFSRRPHRDDVPGVPSPGDFTAILDRAFSDPNPDRPQRTHAIVVLHRGSIVAERYAPGFDADRPVMGWSMTKSVMNALAGVLVGQGRMRLDAPVSIAEWRRDGDPRRSITLDHLLRMSSGLRFDEAMNSARSGVLRMLLASGDVSAFAAQRELVATPGSRWEYSSGSTNIIARAIRNVLNDDAEYHALPRKVLFDPLGMSSAVIEADAAGTFVGSSFMYATARDWARFGMLYLRDGVWQGERILAEGWVSYSTSPAPADPSQRYGAHFWRAVPEEYCASGGILPPDAFHAIGHEGQFVTIVPSRDAVVVRLGRSRYPGAWDHCAFVRDVVAPLATDPAPALDEHAPDPGLRTSGERRAASLADRRPSR